LRWCRVNRTEWAIAVALHPACSAADLAGQNLPHQTLKLNTSVLTDRARMNFSVFQSVPGCTFYGRRGSSGFGFQKVDSLAF
jgi:hypothetical protein